MTVIFVILMIVIIRNSKLMLLFMLSITHPLTGTERVVRLYDITV